MKLGKVVVRDMFDRPQRLLAPKGSELQRAIDWLESEGIRHFAVCNRSSDKFNVIGSKEIDGCAICGELVWAAPSTLRSLEEEPKRAIVCLPCLEAAAKRPERP